VTLLLAASDAIWVAFINIIPALVVIAALGFLAIKYRKEIPRALSRLQRFSSGGLEIELAIVDLKTAQPDAPVSDENAGAVARRVKHNFAVIRGGRVLWVDNKPMGNTGERTFLRSAGISVTNALSTEEGLDQLRRDDYDVVITNQSRGGVQNAGEELADLAWAHDSKVPFIAYIGTVDPERPTPAHFRGVTNRPDELVHFVLDVLESRTAPDPI
jgi:CheY-like chemotaxis protein